LDFFIFLGRIFGISLVLGRILIDFTFFSFFLDFFSQTLNFWLNFLTLLIIFWVQKTRKHTLKKINIQIGVSLFFLNTLNFGGFLILLGGNYFNSQFFLVLGKILVCFNLLTPLFRNFQVSNKAVEEGIFLRNLKIFLLIVLIFQVFSKILSLILSNFTTLDFLTFPLALKNWILFSQFPFFKFFITNYFKFQAIGDGFFIFFFLTFLYYSAFFLLKEIGQKDYGTDENFDNLNSKTKNFEKLLLPNQVFLKTNGNFQNYIGDLLDREWHQGESKKNNSWAIKKKGISVPFNRMIWNNELPFSKQGFWYEIKKK